MNFLKKIFSPTALTISFLLLIYIFYKSEITFNREERDYYFIYYLITLFLILFSIITFFINQKIKEYLIISGISLVVSLYLFEGYLYYKGYLVFKNQISKEQIYKKQTGKKWDTRSRIQIFKDLKKVNNEIVVTVAPWWIRQDIARSSYIDKNYSIFPLSGISNSETIYCNENGYYSIYQSDRYGFNNPDNMWEKKETEYLLVGDSFTHGACVNRPNDIASVLRTLSNKSVLNLGYAGNGPLVEYATLREYLNSNVKKVLWIYYEGNDLNGLKEEMREKILMSYLNDLTFTQNLKLKQNEINDLAKNITEREYVILKEDLKTRKKKIFKLHLINFIKIYNTRNLIFPPKQTQSKLSPLSQLQPEFKKILELTKDLTNKNNSKLYFVYLPEYTRFKTNYDNKNYNLVKEIVNELNIPFIDIYKDVFEKEKNPLKLFPFELDNHYNQEGYKKVGEKIYKFTND